MNGSKILLRILSFSLIGIIFILAFALAVTLRTNRDAELARIVDEQPESQERADQNESGQPAEASPEEILDIQKFILSSQHSERLRGKTEDEIINETGYRVRLYASLGYPEHLLQVEVARPAVIEHLRNRLANATSPVTHRMLLNDAWRMGISADEISSPSSEEQMEKTKIIIQGIVNAQHPTEIEPLLEPLKMAALSNEELDLFVEIVPQLDTPNAIPVIDFLAAYRDRQPCLELLGILCKSDNMVLLKHALDKLGGSRADGIDSLLCALLLRDNIPDDIRISAFRILIYWSTRDPAASALATELDKGTEEWQIRVIRCLEIPSFRMSAPWLVDALIEKTRRGSDEIKRAALGPLRIRSGGERVLTLLVEIAEDNETAIDVRVKSLELIQRQSMLVIHYPRVINTIDRLLRSETIQIRQAAGAVLKDVEQHIERDTPEGQRREQIERLREHLDEWQAARAHIAGRTDPESREALKHLDELIKQAQEALEQLEKE